MPVRLPSYIYRNRCGIFYFRVVVPHAIATSSGSREFRLSLRTADRTEAIGASRYIALHVTELFDKLRAFTQDETSEMPHRMDPERFKAWLENVKKQGRLRERIDELEEQNTNDLIEHKRELNSLRQKAKVAAQIAYSRGVLRATGVPAGEAAKSSGPLISQVIEDYARFKAAKDDWSGKTREENLAILSTFIRIVGDLPIAELTDDNMVSYVETLKKLPPNLTKRFPGMALGDILATNPEPISVRTFNKNVERVSSLIKWAIGKPKYRLTHNPAAGLSMADDKSAKRMPFTDSELIALFTSPEFTQREFQNVYAYWLMPLALFTGARLGELTQLYVSDVVQLDGLPCLNISDEEVGQRVKNNNAKRLVPLHSALIDLGFLRYIENLRAEGVERVFPELNLRRDGYAHAASSWFQRYVRRCGVHVKHTKVFHSFRHTFICQLLDGDVPEHAIAKIVGHEAKLITGKVYWNSRDARKRQPTVEKFKLPDDVLKLIPKFEEMRRVPLRGKRR
jgi:integrase